MKDTVRTATAIKEKAKLIRCTNWLVSQNYVSFWRTPPPIGKSRNHWKSSSHTSSNRGGWSMFHPPPTIDGWATQPYQRANITNTKLSHALSFDFWGWWKKHVSPITNWHAYLYHSYKIYNI